MKSTLTILLASLFLLQSFTRTFIVVNYQLNKDYISNVLCENKAKREMHCEGKCHLKKELQKEEEKESTPSGSSKEKFEVTLFNTINATRIVFSESNLKTVFHYSETKTDNIPVQVFHPPGFTANHTFMF